MEHSKYEENKEKIFHIIKLIRPIDIAVIIVSIIALYMFQFQDGYQLTPIWQLKQPLYNQEKLYCQPLITDIDGNSLNEIIIIADDKLQIFVHHSNNFDDDHPDKDSKVLQHLHLKNEVKLSDIVGKEDTDIYPVAINTGCETLDDELCKQCLAVVLSDWSVLVLSNELKLLWKSRPFKLQLSPKLHFSEMNVLIASPNINTSLVILAGVLNFKEKYQTGEQRSQTQAVLTSNKTAEVISEERAGVEPNITHHIIDPELSKFVGHYTTYALDLPTGKLRWKHEPGDFEEDKFKDQEDLSHLHFKLRLRQKRLHKGEEHWSKYSQSFLNHMPFSWLHSTDTYLSLGNFESDTVISKSDREPKQGFLDEVFLKKQQIEEVEEQEMNVVVLHHQSGIEVLDVNHGSPVSTLPLDISRNGALADINHDNIIDVLWSDIYPLDCYLIATSYLTPQQQHFNSSLCQLWSLFGTTSEYDEVHGSLPAFVVSKSTTRGGALNHMLGYNYFQTPQKTGSDVFVLLSSGKLTAFSSSGVYHWQVDTWITWDHDAQLKPSIKVVSVTTHKVKDVVVILGSESIVAVSLQHGNILSKHSLPCSAVQPLISGDIDNDVSEEYLVRCSDRYVGFTLIRYNRIYLTLLLYAGVICFVAFLWLIIKFFENEDEAMDTIAAILDNMRLLPSTTPRFN